MITTVFFDLDDTLFDHQFSRRCGLAAIRALHPSLQSADIHEMERFHERLIWKNFEKVLSKEIPLPVAIADRIEALCTRFGLTLTPDELPATVRCYDAAYRENRRAVPGSRELLAALRERVRIGIITNGFTGLQQEKLAVCGLMPFMDLVFISEETGFTKPDPRIFDYALSQAKARPEEAVYIGDSWEVDILPACSCGIRPVWLNRYGRPCPDPLRAREITSYGEMSPGDLLE